MNNTMKWVFIIVIIGTIIAGIIIAIKEFDKKVDQAFEGKSKEKEED